MRGRSIRVKRLRGRDGIIKVEHDSREAKMMNPTGLGRSPTQVGRQMAGNAGVIRTGCRRLRVRRGRDQRSTRKTQFVGDQFDRVTRVALAHSTGLYGMTRHVMRACVCVSNCLV